MGVLLMLVIAKITTVNSRFQHIFKSVHNKNTHLLITTTNLQLRLITSIKTTYHQLHKKIS